MTATMSTLMLLPLEIRLQILDHVFADFALSIERTSGCNSAVLPYSVLSRRSLGLLRTNHQLRHECANLLDSKARLLAFRIPFIEGLEVLPPVKSKFAWGIRVVIFPSRAGSQELLSMLPNLEAIGVCRSALSGGPPLVFREEGNIKNLPEFMYAYVSNGYFVHGLCQQWLLQYLRNPTRKAKVWCRIVSIRMDPSKPKLSTIREAVWIDLDQRTNTKTWQWCRPTSHELTGRLESGGYHSELVGEVGDGNLEMINKWWTAAHRPATVI